jgi:CDP-diacylglycerol--glycerol-3-phosphate 3-phosphatidyltransferase
MKLNLANRITLIRILVVPILVVLLTFPSRLNCLLAMLFFIAASLTDMVDGLVARRHNMVSTFGKFLDPLADKILISSVLVMLVQLQDDTGRSWAPAWVAIIIIGRELMVTGMRSLAADKGMIIAADTFGKIKTILQILALCPLILHYPWMGLDLASLGKIMLYIALVMTVFSGGNYLYSFYNAWLDEERRP